MQLTFESIEEVKEFVKALKGTRGKGDKGDEGEATHAPTPAAAPAPLQPPQTTPAAFAPQAAQPAAFAPPAQGVAPGGAFPAAGAAPAVAPEVQALVDRISKRIDGAVASGQPAEAVLGWFRANIGNPEAANATMDQIKTVYLFKASVPVLENIAKLMAA